MTPAHGPHIPGGSSCDLRGAWLQDAQAAPTGVAQAREWGVLNTCVPPDHSCSQWPRHGLRGTREAQGHPSGWQQSRTWEQDSLSETFRTKTTKLCA